MKRILLVLSVALAAGLTVPLVGSAAEGDSPRPCADILDGFFAYIGPNWVVEFRTAAPACNGGVSYTVVVSGGTTTTVNSPTAVVPDGAGSRFSFANTHDVGLSGVCIYAEASVGRGHHVFDRMPDTGCKRVEFGGIFVEDF